MKAEEAAYAVQSFLASELAKQQAFATIAEALNKIGNLENTCTECEQRLAGLRAQEQEFTLTAAAAGEEHDRRLAELEADYQRRRGELDAQIQAAREQTDAQVRTIEARIGEAKRREAMANAQAEAAQRVLQELTDAEAARRALQDATA